MENLFRLLLARPAVAQDPENPSIRLAQDTSFQGSLRSAVSATEKRTAIEAAATAFVDGPDFIGDPADTPLGDKLDELARRLDELETDNMVSYDTVKAAIDQVFGVGPD